ncbi:MAG: tetratricopeptide repeat protein, partial [Thermoguttaceae bacterium]
FNRATADIRLGRKIEAIFDFTKAIELRPRYADAYCKRGVMYAEVKNFEAARNDLRKAMQFDPTLEVKVRLISERYGLGL